jgi:hypothetical protein
MSRLTTNRVSGILTFSMLLTACSSSTEPSGNPRVRLDFQSTEEVSGVAPTAEVLAGIVVLRGVFSTPCNGYAVGGNATDKSGTMEVTVTGRQASAVCTPGIGRFPYRATVSGVTPGDRRVIVRHVIDGANSPAETVIDTTLRVP